MSGAESSALVRSANRNVRVRKSVYRLTDSELNDLRNAFEGLYAVSADGGNNDERGYQWIAGVHGLPIPFYCQHGNLNFPTWHRAYIYEFELRLQDQVAGVMLPYWDWTSAEAIANGLPKAVTDQTYVDLQTGETKPNPLYAAFSQVTGTMTQRSPSPSSALEQLKLQVELALRQKTYDRFSPALENPHGGLHVWVGGDMASVPTAAYDPIFWMHHCNVDRQWFEWQRQNGDSTVPQAQLDFVCAPFTYTGEQTLDTKFFGYTYVDAEAFVEINQETMPRTDTGNELSFQIPFHTTPFKHAFLELQGVAKTEDSYKVNIYLGDGSDSSGADSPDPAAGFASTLYLFGHGQCAGGKGHCQYANHQQPFDRRPESHLKPYNTYVDITEALKRYKVEDDKVRVTLKVYDCDANATHTREVKMRGASIVTHE
ncbi:hypothetical protein WH50_16000 [Pokkaliibacter plantistimulans]|uniref:Tyrosinase copper-binding domain-containing protein n=1 Tax=Pokkaliibacter plantistimulans TaxID=1635171 RepID=A0ABX5LUF6_9GAMM|nr:tyrosinase family protein [Pokkaliibacter plantistimulans]PXF30311.1 hypothetical protein WH50_16000 [Pokkaliibacter plantistimulans]